MDFDDLDAEADARIAAGEEVAGHERLNNQAAKGEVLPLITRNFRIPQDRKLPEKIRNKLPPHTEPVKERKPRIRLLCIYGAGDSVASVWCQWQHDAPEDIEMVTYEWPGHGTREEEPLLRTLDELRDDAFEAFRDAMDTGSFGILGHSIGCLIATALCERAQRELNVRPLFAVMLERAPPHVNVLSPVGMEMLDKDPKKFCSLYCGDFILGLGGQHGVDMWQNDMHLENDNREIGFYKYPCPLMTVCALDNYAEEKYVTEPEWLAARKEPLSIRARGTMWNFTREMYKEWEQWCDDKVEVMYIETNHYGVKQHTKVRDNLWRTLRKVVGKL